MSLNDRLESFFRAHVNEWVDGRHLGTIAGAYAWRSRVSDLRVSGMDIVNRQRRIPKLLNPAREAVTISEYCFVVPEPTQAPLFVADELAAVRD